MRYHCSSYRKLTVHVFDMTVKHTVNLHTKYERCSLAAMAKRVIFFTNKFTALQFKSFKYLSS